MDKLLEAIEKYLSGKLSLDDLKYLSAGIVGPADTPVAQLASKVISGVTFVEEQAISREDFDEELRETAEQLRSRAA